MAKAKKKIGRPSKRTPAVIEKIIDGLSHGIPLTDICRDEKMPSPRTVREWAEGDADLSAAIARARDLGFDAIAEECLDIADNAANDWMERRNDKGDVIGWQLNGEHVQRSKLRIETRLKLLAKWNPKKYGELIKLSGADGEGPVNVKVTADMTPEEAAEAYAKLVG